MALYRESAGIVGIAAPGEVTFGTAVARTHVLYCDSASFAVSFDQFDKGTLSTGFEESSGLVSTYHTTAINLTGPCCDKSLPILLALATGTDTKYTVLTSATQHSIDPVGATVELPSTCIEIHHDSLTGTTYGGLFSGCVLNSLTISGANNGQLTYSAQFLTCKPPAVAADGGTPALGLATLAGLSAPTALPWLFAKGFFKTWSAKTTAPYFDVPTIGIDPDAYDGISTGWANATMTDHSHALNSFSYTINNNLIGIRTGVQTGGVSKFVRGQREQTISVGLWFDDTDGGNDATFITDLASMDALGTGADKTWATMFYLAPSHTAGTGTMAYATFAPRASLVSVTPPTGNPRQLTANFKLTNATSGIASVYHVVVNNENVEYA